MQTDAAQWVPLAEGGKVPFTSVVLFSTTGKTFSFTPSENPYQTNAYCLNRSCTLLVKAPPTIKDHIKEEETIPVLFLFKNNKEIKVSAKVHMVNEILAYHPDVSITLEILNPQDNWT